jgi:hypothetical protein
MPLIFHDYLQFISFLVFSQCPAQKNLASGQKVEGGSKGRETFCPRAKSNRGQPRRLLVQSRAKQNTLFLLEEFFGGACKSEIVKSILLGGER